MWDQNDRQSCFCVAATASKPFLGWKQSGGRLEPALRKPEAGETVSPLVYDRGLGGRERESSTANRIVVPSNTLKSLQLHPFLPVGK